MCIAQLPISDSSSKICKFNSETYLVGAMQNSEIGHDTPSRAFHASLLRGLLDLYEKMPDFKLFESHAPPPPNHLTDCWLESSKI